MNPRKKRSRYAAGTLLTLLVITLALSTYATAGVGSGVQWLWQELLNMLQGWTSQILSAEFNALLAMMRWDPTFFCFSSTGCKLSAGVGEMSTIFKTMLVPVYVIAMTFTAIFFIIRAGSPAGRARAKSMFYKLTIGMLFVILSDPIFQTLLDLNGMLLEIVIGPGFILQGGINHLNMMTQVSGGKVLAAYLTAFLTAYVVIPLALFIAVARYFWVYVYGLVFPFILFLYSFDVTKSTGKKWFKKAIKWIFVPSLQGLILAFTAVSLESLTAYNSPFSGVGGYLATFMGAVMSLFLVLGGLVTFIVAPIVMAKMMVWMGNAIMAVGMSTNQSHMVALGGLLMGGGPNVLRTAHGEFTRSRGVWWAESALGGYKQPGIREVSSRPGGGFIKAQGGGRRVKLSGGGGGALARQYVPTFGGEIGRSIEESKRKPVETYETRPDYPSYETSATGLTEPGGSGSVTGEMTGVGGILPTGKEKPKEKRGEAKPAGSGFSTMDLDKEREKAGEEEQGRAGVSPLDLEEERKDVAERLRTDKDAGVLDEARKGHELILKKEEEDVGHERSRRIKGDEELIKMRNFDKGFDAMKPTEKTK